MKRAGFSMLELVIVIVTIGIIVSVSMPKFGRNELTLATHQLANHIRYTQHLAMQDDKFNSSNDWFKDRWKISFDSNSYTISSNVTARNPQNLNLTLTGTSTPELNLQKKYKVEISFNDKCNTNGLSFDSLGRPIHHLTSPAVIRAYTNLLDSECKITISRAGEGSNTITIHSETGFVEIN